MMTNKMPKQFGQADDLTTTNLRKQGEVAFEVGQGEGALDVDAFFDLLGDVHDESTTKSDDAKMETNMSTPVIVHSVLSVPVESDGSTSLPRAAESTEYMPQPYTTAHSSSSFTTAPQEAEALDTLCVRSNLPLRESPSTQSESQTVSLSDFQALVQKMKALERKMASDGSVLLNQRMKVLEAHMDSDTFILLYQRVEALETHLDSDTTTLLNQRVKALEARMASETSTLLGQRVKALETKMDSDTLSSLDRRVKALETKMASGPVPWLNQQLGKLETKIYTKISALVTQGKADQKSISTLKQTLESSQARIWSRFDKITNRLDKMHNRIVKTEGRLDKIKQ